MYVPPLHCHHLLLMPMAEMNQCHAHHHSLVISLAIGTPINSLLLVEQLCKCHQEHDMPPSCQLRASMLPSTFASQLIPTSNEHGNMFNGWELIFEESGNGNSDDDYSTSTSTVWLHQLAGNRTTHAGSLLPLFPWGRLPLPTSVQFAMNKRERITTAAVIIVVITNTIINLNYHFWKWNVRRGEEDPKLGFTSENEQPMLLWYNSNAPSTLLSQTIPSANIHSAVSTNRDLDIIRYRLHQWWRSQQQVAANADSTGHDLRGRDYRPTLPAIINSILEILYGMSRRKIALNLDPTIWDLLTGVTANQNSANLWIN